MSGDRDRETDRERPREREGWREWVAVRLTAGRSELCCALGTSGGRARQYVHVCFFVVIADEMIA